MTVSTATISLQNAGVNSGTAVDLHGAEFDYDFNLLSSTEPAPGKFGKVDVNHQGYDNPKISIRGFIDADRDTSNKITEKLLKSFAISQTQNYLIIRYGSHGLEQSFSQIDGTNETVGSDSAIKIVFKKVTIKANANAAANGHVLAFTLDLFEDL